MIMLLLLILLNNNSNNNTFILLLNKNIKQNLKYYYCNVSQWNKNKVFKTIIIQINNK